LGSKRFVTIHNGVYAALKGLERLHKTRPYKKNGASSAKGSEEASASQTAISHDPSTVPSLPTPPAYTSELDGILSELACIVPALVPAPVASPAEAEAEADAEEEKVLMIQLRLAELRAKAAKQRLQQASTS
jgi:hypothetical protein